MTMMRIDKFICDAGLAGRREARQLIKAGRIAVNGVAVTDCDFKLTPDKDTVTLDGRETAYRRFHYYIMNKPAGILTATEDRKQPTVADLLPDQAWWP